MRRAGEQPVFQEMQGRASDGAPHMGRQANWDPFLFIHLCEQYKYGETEYKKEIGHLQRVEFAVMFDYVWRRVRLTGATLAQGVDLRGLWRACWSRLSTVPMTATPRPQSKSSTRSATNAWSRSRTRPARKLRSLLERQGRPQGALRVAVIGGGCSGLQYKMDLVDGPANRDIMVESAQVRVVIDPKSALFVSGSLLDYSDDLQKGGFKVTNPNAVAHCSCGESFSA